MININAIWDKASEKLCIDMVAVSFEVWVKNLEPVCIAENNLILLAPSFSAKSLITKNYLALIGEAVKIANPSLCGAEIITEEEKPRFLKLQTEVLDDQLLIKENTRLTAEVPAFTSKYTFDSFVVGTSNQFAAAAARAVSESPGDKYNPLFLYGGVGLGKTHIMHAIGNYIRKTRPDAKIKYVATDQFTNELVDTIRNSNDRELNKSFRENYRNVDVLMLDDIQFLAGRSGTQDAIFHIFNDLYQNGKQIVLSSDRPPKEISPLEERLRSRFEWGLLADIQAPDLETRIAILRSKSQEEHFFVKDDVLEFIANKVENNIREMEGLLSKVLFYANLLNYSTIDIGLAREALKDYINTKEYIINIDTIIKATCTYFNVTAADLTGHRRNKEIVEPRMVCIYLITDLLNLPLALIGNAMGGRDHTTIIHSRDKIGEALSSNTLIRKQVQDLKDSILKK